MSTQEPSEGKRDAGGRFPLRRWLGLPKLTSGQHPTRARYAQATLAGAMGSLGAVNLLAFCTGIVRLKAFALFLGPAGIAVVGLATTFFELLATAARMGIPTGLVREMARHLAGGNEALGWRILRDSRRLLAVVGVVAGAACVALPATMLERLLGVALPRWFYFSLCVVLPAHLLASGAEAGLNALGAIRAIALAKAITVSGSLVFAVGLAAWLGVDGGVAQVLTGGLFASAVAEVLLAASRGRTGADDAAVDRGEARAAMRQVLGIGGAQFIYHVAVAANRVALRSLAINWLGIAPAGFVQVTLAISQQYTVAVSAGMFVYLYPRFSSQLGNATATADEAARATRFVLAILVPSACLQQVFRTPGVALVLSPQFMPVAALLALTIPMDLLFLVATVPRTVMLAQGRRREYVALGVGGEALRLLAFAVGLALGTLSTAVIGLLLAEAVILVTLILRMSSQLGRQRRSWSLLSGGLALIALLALVPQLSVAVVLGLLAAGVWLWCSRDAIREGVT